jgi:hypothetical protein
VHFPAPARVLERRVQLGLEFPPHRLKVLVPFVTMQIAQVIFFTLLVNQK